jgi:hypothetical protein
MNRAEHAQLEALRANMVSLGTIVQGCVALVDALLDSNDAADDDEMLGVETMGQQHD